MSHRAPSPRRASRVVGLVLTSVLMLVLAGSVRAQDSPADWISTYPAAWIDASQQALNSYQQGLNVWITEVQGGTIAWRPTYESALSEARDNGRPVWLQFTGPWCRYCSMMESTTFQDPKVITEVRKRVVPVKVQADQRQDLLASYEVSSLPTTILLDSRGREMARFQGYLDPSQFLGALLYASPGERDQVAQAEPPGPEPALGGYCPVHLVKTGELKTGTEDHTFTYDGQLFRFSSAEARSLFLAEPERYLPRDQGRCVVTEVDKGLQVPGDPAFGVYYQNRLYLCSSAEARAAFAASPQRYADADLGLAGYCPHCREIAGRMVPGSEDCPLTVQGTRYLFPDASHREAFLADLQRAVR